MKSVIRYIAPLAGLAAAMPALRAEDADSPEAPQVKKEMRVIVGPDAPPPGHHGHHMLINPHEMESVTFLGVSTAPAPAVLADQLNLAKNTGLVVTIVAENSPATSVLKRNDVLVKLDDQLLIEQRQLSVLIRNHKEGDEVALTYIRGGKEQTARVKLGKHDVPKMAMLEEGMMHDGNFAYAFGGAGPDREEMDRVLRLMDHGGPGQPLPPDFNPPMPPNGGPEMHTVTVNTSNSTMAYNDEQGSLDLTIKDGKKTLVATNAKGEQVFSGPVNTPEERAKMPAEVRARLDRVENMQGYSFKTDGEFQPGETKDARPAPHGIGLPVPPPPPGGKPTPTF